MRNDQEAEIRARDEYATRYASEYRRGKGAWWDDLELSMLVEAISPRPGMRVLDAGAGVGRVAKLLAERRCIVDAVDFSLQSLRVLRRTSGETPSTIRPIVGDLTGGLPFPNSVVDAIICSQVVHHIPTSYGRSAVWRELSRVATPDATLAIIVYNARHGSSPEGYFSNGIFFHRYTADQLSDELNVSGWQLAQISYWYRLDWPRVASVVPRLLETYLARAHIADNRATYLFCQARKKQQEKSASY